MTNLGSVTHSHKNFQTRAVTKAVNDPSSTASRFAGACFKGLSWTTHTLVMHMSNSCCLRVSVLPTLRDGLAHVIYC